MSKKKRAKVGRRMIYPTPAKFARAVTAYFDAISYELPYTREDGSPICNLNGDPIILVKYITPPSLQELHLFLHIDSSTWDNYRAKEGYNEVCAEAKLRVEAYLTEQVNTRDRPQGIMFNLENNFDWKNKKEVDLGEGTRKAMQLASMTIEEKKNLLAATLPELAGFAAAGEPEDYADEDD